MSTEALRAALEALINAASDYVKPRRATDARQVLLERLDAARAALAQPSVSAEPVAWCALTQGGKIAYFDGKPMVMIGPIGNVHHTTPLYTVPPVSAERKPLSDEQISNRLWESDWPEVMLSDFVRAKLFAFARAIEKAHGVF